jgi:SAM-dependent methyltransferase
MRRRTCVLVGLGATAAAVVLVRHGRLTLPGRRAPEGIVIGDAGLYDAMSRLLFGSFFDGVAGDVGATVGEGAKVLEIGCGPGHLAIRLAEHGLDVTALDVDVAMIARARANAALAGVRVTCVVGDVGALDLPDGSFDAVVSTLSMHHWADAALGLSEVARVLRPGGTALVWDLGPGVGPLHAHLPDPVERARDAPMQFVDAARWPWPWRWNLTTRIVLEKPG